MHPWPAPARAPEPDGAVVSGEGVRLELATAGVASRALAAAVDLVVEVIALGILFLVTVVAAGVSDDAALAALGLVETLFVLAGYPIVFEWLSRGRTLGKLWVGLRTVRDDGGPIDFRAALVRGLAGLIIEKPGLLPPFTTLAGVLTVTASRRDTRIGDLMAGTVVLNLRAAPQQLADPPLWVEPPLRPWVLAADLSRVDDRFALTLRQFVARAYAMTPTARAALGQQLRALVSERVSPPPPDPAPTPAVLMAVLAERRRRAGEPVAGTPSGPWAEGLAGWAASSPHRRAPAPAFDASASTHLRPPATPHPPPTAATRTPNAPTSDPPGDDSPFAPPR